MQNPINNSHEEVTTNIDDDLKNEEPKLKKRKVEEIHAENMQKAKKLKKIRYGQKQNYESDQIEFDFEELGKTPEERLESWHALLTIERSHHPKGVSTGIWTLVDGKPMVKLTKPKGHVIQTMGEMIKHFSEGSHLYLYPEEAVYLTDICKLQIFYNQKLCTIQDAFRLLLESGYPFERYLCYARLRHMGFIVRRHDKTTHARKGVVENKPLKERSTKYKRQVSNPLSLLHFKSESGVEDPNSILGEHSFFGDEKPMIAKLQLREGQEIDPKKIYEFLKIVKPMETNLTKLEDKYQVVFDAWKPTGKHVSRNSLQRPMFSVIVTDYNSLFPPVDVIARIKIEYPNVPIYFSIVDGGTVSFFSIHDFDIPDIFENRI